MSISYQAAPCWPAGFGISGKAVYDLAKAEILVRVSRDQFSLEDSVRRYCEHIRRTWQRETVATRTRTSAARTSGQLPEMTCRHVLTVPRAMSGRLGNVSRNPARFGQTEQLTSRPPTGHFRHGHSDAIDGIGVEEKAVTSEQGCRCTAASRKIAFRLSGGLQADLST